MLMCVGWSKEILDIVLESKIERVQDVEDGREASSSTIKKTSWYKLTLMDAYE